MATREEMEKRNKETVDEGIPRMILMDEITETTTLSKQEVIREGIEHVITVNHPYIASKITEEIIKYLHSQGCVLRVDRELPPSRANETEWSGKVNWDDGYRHAEARYKLAGYHATEPLVEE